MTASSSLLSATSGAPCIEGYDHTSALKYPAARSLRVGMDLDGVCHQFAPALARALSQLRGVDVSTLPDVTCWDFYSVDWGMTKADYLALCHEAVDAGLLFADGEPYTGAADAWRRIKAAGHSIHVVTDRSFGTGNRSQINTAAWLKAEGFPEPDSITYSADKTSVPTDVFIEDKLENYDALDAAGVEVYLVTQPWNDVPDDRRRVSSVGEFADLIVAGAIPSLQRTKASADAA